MGNSLRCCCGCMLPCGAFGVVYVVDLCSHIEYYSGHVTAGGIMAAHPGHVLIKRVSQRGGGAGRIKIISPESELERGCIYYLFPAKHASSSAVSGNELGMLPERRSRRHCSGVRSGRRVWRPQLESIAEDV